jgi:purine-binding chemotaxis protein CheW
MNATRSRIDWQQVKQRVTANQALLDQAERVDRAAINRVFGERAARLAKRGRGNIDRVATSPILVILLAGERFGIPLDQLEQVYPRGPITVLPGAAEHLLGVTNLQGTARSVIDVRRLLQLPADAKEDGYVVLLKVDGSDAALWVEQFEGIDEADLNNLASVDANTPDESASIVRGLTDDGVAVLNLEELMARIR